ncbi:MAG: hypothetical protein HDQ95_05880 [Roseburia sp.]|nr:hypothetical protein [Roseburia sp.]
MIELTGGYRYHEDRENYICDDRDFLENVRIVRSMTDEEFEQLQKELKELEEKKHK